MTARAPIRVCDIGGWTDTWFARHGRVCNIAVSPYAEVRVEIATRAEGSPQVMLEVKNYGDRYAIDLSQPLPDRHPLLEAAIDEVGVPDGLAIHVSVACDAPAGCSTGTSAAVLVALLGALDAVTPGRLQPLDIALLAHRIEVERLGLQSGVQDQLASAFGGINVIEIDDYPHASVTPLAVKDETAGELERRLVVVFLGRGHVSSAVHEKVIAELSDEGPGSPRLETLRTCASRAADALLAGDLDGFGRWMTANTEAQARLHPDLVGPEASVAIDAASACGAAGWKVNGAGGAGGSLTALASKACDRHALVTALEGADPSFRVLPTALARTGLRVSS